VYVDSSTITGVNVTATNVKSPGTRLVRGNTTVTTPNYAGLVTTPYAPTALGPIRVDAINGGASDYIQGFAANSPFPTFRVRGDGLMCWGSGAATGDVCLSRDFYGGGMGLNGNLSVQGGLTVSKIAITRGLAANLPQPPNYGDQVWIIWDAPTIWSDGFCRRTGGGSCRVQCQMDGATGTWRVIGGFCPTP
jgi:hypothetical protein